MVKLAVTGNMGCGKTTVCEMLISLYIPVYFSDTRAKELMNQDYEMEGESMTEQSNVIVGTPKPGGAERWSKMSSQEKAEYTAQKALNQARGIAARYDAAKKAAKNVNSVFGVSKMIENTEIFLRNDCLGYVATEKW